MREGNMTDLIQVSRRDGLMEIKFNRPERKNALSNEMYTRMADLIVAPKGADSLEPAVQRQLFSHMSSDEHGQLRWHIAIGGASRDPQSSALIAL
jgi:hypothetical protein